MFYYPETPVSDFTQDEEPKFILGGKGSGLAVMASLGVSVPPFMVIPTTLCVEYMKKPKTTMKKIGKNLPEVMQYFRDKFGYLPLVSVRSGARVSCPGMMDTILNVGLDASTYPYWLDRLGVSCASDSYARLIQMFGNVVEGIPREALDYHRLEDGSVDLTSHLAKYQQLKQGAFPAAEEQWLLAIEAVFKSWNNERAKTYRKLNNIPDEWGTAVVIQAMVFGNLNDQSCTGVLFTRNPNSGESHVTGEFLVNAQGEDVVAGIRTPEPLIQMMEWNNSALTELLDQVKSLEKHFRDMQDVEFTVQDGKLFILQTRNGKRTAKAAVRIALDLLKEDLIVPHEMKQRVTFKQWLLATQPVISPEFNTPPNGVGIPASSGLAVGKAVFSAEAAVASKEPCIMISRETTPDDIAGMNASVGILTAIGGATSHAAVVARGMDRTCVVGCTDLKRDANEQWWLNGLPIHEGTQVTLDGDTGRVWVGVTVPILDGQSNKDIQDFSSYVLEHDSACPLVVEGDPIPEHDCFYLSGSVEHLKSVAPHLRGYVDIRDRHETMPPTFQAILMAGHGVHAPQALPSLQPARAEALVQLAQESELKFKVIVSDEGVADRLKSAGFLGKVVTPSEGWEDLLFKEGEVYFKEPKVAESLEAERLLQLRHKAQEPVALLSVGRAESHPFGKAFMSVQQRMRRVLA